MEKVGKSLNRNSVDLKNAGIIFLFAILILTSQIVYRVFLMGDDWIFHWNRFFEAGMQMKTADINLFQSMFGFDRSSRIVNAVYGLPFAYIHGFALMLFKSAFKTQLLSNFVCLLSAGLGTYLLMRYCKIRKSVSLPIICLLFCCILRHSADY